MYRISEIANLPALLKNIFDNKNNGRIFIIVILSIGVSMLGFYLVSTNEKYYKKTIAKITSVAEKESHNTQNDPSKSYDQQLKATIMNGIHKGKEIQLNNSVTFSQAYNFKFKVNDEVFVALNVNANNEIISSTITEIKRDKYIIYVFTVFAALILLIGKGKGLRSLISLIANVFIFLVIVKLFSHGYNPIAIASIASILFVSISIAVVNGINKKSLSSVIGTIAGTLCAMLIAVIVVALTKTTGLGYQEADFFSSLPQKSDHTVEQIFLSGVLIGTLGAIMDIAVCISSSIQEICNANPGISKKELIRSGMEIGKDTMGTMANTLFFAYISGSIPLILVLFKNSISLTSIIGINISLEIIRALTGSIGIVISVPLTILVSVALLKNNRIGEA
jgi:uncharacterized membrane protein